jgi:succinyl-CoA synthetase beta subunit
LLNEANSKRLLSEIGVDTPRNVVVKNRELLTNLPLVFPVVIKALGLAHKTENRGVRLGIKNIDELQVAFDEMGYREYLIEEMIGEVLIELLVGIINDPAHGFVFTIASGGILTEILSDSESLVMPFTKSELTTALNNLKIAKIFSGYRGSEPINMAPLIENIFKLQEFVVKNCGELSELEINPFLITASRAVAVDALIKM